MEKIHPSQQWRPYEDSSFGSLHNHSLLVTASSSSSSTAVYSAHHHPSSTTDDLIVGRREWESNQGLKGSSLRNEIIWNSKIEEPQYAVDFHLCCYVA